MVSLALGQEDLVRMGVSLQMDYGFLPTISAAGTAMSVLASFQKQMRSSSQQTLIEFVFLSIFEKSW